ncbi:MAG: amidohydrolase [Pseudomonadota bacterium]
MTLPSTPEHTIFFNGQVVSVDSDNRLFEAMSIRDGIIEQLGTSTNVLSQKRHYTKLVDLKGRTLLPGIVDAHSHFPSTGLTTIGVSLYPSPIGKIRSRDQLMHAVADAVEKQGDTNEWVLGLGYDNSLIFPPGHPDRKELDRVAPATPVFLWHQSGHFAVVNTAGLQKLALTDETDDPQGGFYGRYSDGSLNGLLAESAVPGLNEILSGRSLAEYRDVFRIAEHEYIANGITTAQSGSAPRGLSQILKWITRLGLTPLKFSVLERQSASGNTTNKWAISKHFSNRAVKLFVDGSPQGYTASLTEPYYDQSGYNGNYRGSLLVNADELSAQFSDINAQGRQIAVHANGDRAIDTVISAFTKSGIDPQSDHRTLLIHAQTIRTDQLIKLQSLGISPSYFITHTYFFGDLHKDKVLGLGRAQNISPLRSTQKLGIRFSLHSDSPVTPVDPMQILWSATNRQTLSGLILGAREIINIENAVRAITIDAAWQIFEDSSRGSLEPGKAADLVILSDKLIGYSGDIRNIAVDQTIIDGRSVYIRKSPTSSP